MPNPLDGFSLEEPITLNSLRRQKIIQNILSQREQLLLGGTRASTRASRGTAAAPFQFHIDSII